jgi:hypothetical protein
VRYNGEAVANVLGLERIWTLYILRLQVVALLQGRLAHVDYTHKHLSAVCCYIIIILASTCLQSAADMPILAWAVF